MAQTQSMATVPGDTVEERAAVFLPYIDKYRGAMPAGALLAIAENESGMGSSEYNAEAVGKLGHACGPWQIMEAYFGDYHVTATTVWDLDASTYGVCLVRGKAHAVIASLVPAALQDIRLYTYLLYLSHLAGTGGMQKAVQKLLDAGQAVTVEALEAAGWSSHAGLLRQAERAEYWEQFAISQRGGSPFDPGPSSTAAGASSWGVLIAGALPVLAFATALTLNLLGYDHPVLTWVPRR